MGEYECAECGQVLYGPKHNQALIDHLCLYCWEFYERQRILKGV